MKNDAERTVAAKYDLVETSVPWADLENPRTGARYEVKSTDPTREYPRFRLWRDQHRSLVGYDSQRTAWYAFVAGDRVVRRRPAYVTAVVRELGGWNVSGHARGSKQKKVPAGELL